MFDLSPNYAEPANVTDSSRGLKFLHWHQAPEAPMEQ
jgi:hypothetical protein